MTAMTRLELPGNYKLPSNEESAVAVVKRYFADRGIVRLDDEARDIVTARTRPSAAAHSHADR